MVNRLFIYGLIICLLLGCKEKPLEVKEGFMIINGSDVYYKIMGKGEPLLVIHGGPVLDHSYFLPHFENLARDYQLIFYDQRVCGKSSIDIDSATMNMAGFVEDIEQIKYSFLLTYTNLIIASLFNKLTNRVFCFLF